MKRMMYPSLALLLAFSAFSCSLYSDFNEEIAYTIPEGAHYSTHDLLRYVISDTLDFSFRFDESAVYEIGSDQSDINKLFGFAEGSAQNIHGYSARFGWRWYNDSIEILAYAYTDGDGARASKLLGTVEFGETAQGSITSEEGRYLFTFKGYTAEIAKSPSYRAARKYLSYPYFGGNIAAPHQVTVWVTLFE